MFRDIIPAICLMILTSVPTFASDIEREKRMASEIIDSIIDGEAVYLDADGHRFLGIYTETDSEQVRGAVMVLHGRGFHPDWQDVAGPLRVGLIESGWNTLSLQMPVLQKAAKYYDYVPIFPEAFPRIEAGIEYLKQQGNKKIILVAHSCSAHMVMAWIDAGRFSGVDAYVGIGMGATDYKQPMNKPFPLDRIDVPILDIYGADEYPAVIRGAGERLRLMLSAGNPQSVQIVVPDADHYFTDRGDVLVETLQQWLQTL